MSSEVETSLTLSRDRIRIFNFARNGKQELAGALRFVLLCASMRISNKNFTVATSGKGTYEITDKVEALLCESKIKNGIVTIFAQHTSCSLIVMEDADPTARRDLEEFFDRLVPENADYFEHDSEGADDMPSHIRMVLTHSSETIPVAQGRMQLGTWQGIFLFEHRRSTHRRKVVVTMMGE
jgi:secondary thiamine-phosphate synthase enzyme